MTSEVQPRVAVVIAAHDPGPYLEQTLTSLLAQTVTGWECIVVDDGSLERLGWVAEVDTRIRLVRQDNRGVGAARNAGAARTSAPLLAFLDQDDLWRPGYLQRQVDLLTDSDVVLGSTGFDVIDARSRHAGPGFIGHNRSYEELLGGCGLHCGAVVVRRTAFDRAQGFRSYRVSQDWDLWLRILRDGGRVARTDEVLASWRRHDRNASADYRTLWRDGRQVLAEHDHPAARAGRRRVRRLSGAQALDAARLAGPTPAGVHHLVWAGWHAPAHTIGSALRLVPSRVRRASAGNVGHETGGRSTGRTNDSE